MEKEPYQDPSPDKDSNDSPPFYDRSGARWLKMGASTRPRVYTATSPRRKIMVM